MRPGGPGKRARNNRNHARRGGGGGNRNHSFDSNGPDVKVRGTAAQVAEKYAGLARDATSVGDRVAAENYLQHAEHYTRIVNANNEKAAEIARERAERERQEEPAVAEPVAEAAQAAPVVPAEQAAPVVPAEQAAPEAGSKPKSSRRKKPAATKDEVAVEEAGDEERSQPAA